MQSPSILSLDLEMFVDLIKVDGNLTKIPYNFKDVSGFASQFLEQRNDVCQSVIGTNCKAINEHLIIHNEKDELQSEILMVCRDLEYRNYIVVFIRPGTDENECLASYLYLFSQTRERGELEVVWHKLTQKASSNDWVTIDEIIEDIMTDSSKNLILLDKTFDHHKVFDKKTRKDLFFFLEQAEYFICEHLDEKEYALMLLDREDARGLCAILNNPDGFAKKVIVVDDFEELLVDFKSLGEGYSALYYPMTLRHGYRSLEDAIEEVLMHVESREIQYNILDQLNEYERETIERLILEREDILLEEEYINELRTLSPQEKKIITDRSKS